MYVSNANNISSCSWTCFFPPLICVRKYSEGMACASAPTGSPSWWETMVAWKHSSYGFRGMQWTVEGHTSAPRSIWGPYHWWSAKAGDVHQSDAGFMSNIFGWTQQRYSNTTGQGFCVVHSSFSHWTDIHLTLGKLVPKSEIHKVTEWGPPGYPSPKILPAHPRCTKRVFR